MEVSVQRHASAELHLRKRIPGAHWIGNWVGLRAGVDTDVIGKILCLCRGSNICLQSVVRHYTD
jgi:hypothetical protein